MESALVRPPQGLSLCSWPGQETTVQIAPMRTSVVLPAYNAQHCVGQALESIRKQGVAVDEVIVIDDGSRDETRQIAADWSATLPVRVVCNPRNRGLCYSLRRGVEEASGDLLLRLDADDRWLPTHVGTVLRLATKYPQAVLFSTPALFVSENGVQLHRSSGSNDKKARARLMWDNFLVHSASAFRRSAYDAVGGYREHVLFEDYDLWIRLLEVGELGYANEATVEYLVTQGSLSRMPRSRAIRGRWVCQREAIAAFWPRHPLAALGCLVAGATRTAVSPWI